MLMFPHSGPRKTGMMSAKSKCVVNNQFTIKGNVFNSQKKTQALGLASPRPPKTRTPCVVKMFAPLPPLRVKVRDINSCFNVEQFYMLAESQRKFQKPLNSRQRYTNMDLRVNSELQNMRQDSQRFVSKINLAITDCRQRVVAESKNLQKTTVRERWATLRRIVFFWLHRGPGALAAARVPTSPLSHPAAKEFFETIKFGRATAIAALLQAHPELVFEFDHFSLTALHWAVKRNQIDSLVLLLCQGPEIDRPDRHGRTALAFAVRHHNYEAALALLLVGANPWKAEADSSLFQASIEDKLRQLLKSFRRFQIMSIFLPKSERKSFIARAARENYNCDHLFTSLRNVIL